MTGTGFKTAIVTALILCAISLSAQDIVVTNVSIPSTEWGRQTATVDLQNNGDYKYLVSRIKVIFNDFGTISKRETTKSFILEPSTDSSAQTFRLPFFVPADFGHGQCVIELFDVVDTLDQLYDSYRFFEKTIEFDNPIPEWVAGLLDSGLQCPVFVDQTIRFDNHFARLMTVFLSRGKSLDQISEYCSTDPNFVKGFASHLANKNYYVRDTSSYRPVFPVIEQTDLEAVMPEIDKTADMIYNTFKANMPAYDNTINSLIAQGKLTKDPHNIMDGGSVYHHKYPTFLGLVLWEDLGKQFVNNGEDFDIFNGSNQIEALMGKYMYLVVGPKEDRGDCFYYHINDDRGDRFYCGLFSSPLDRDNDLSKQNNYALDVDFGKDRYPMVYAYSIIKGKKAVDALTEGTADQIAALKKLIDEQFDSSPGARYWSWNLVAEKVMNRLVDEKVIDKPESEIFVFQRME